MSQKIQHTRFKDIILKKFASEDKPQVVQHCVIIFVIPFVFTEQWMTRGVEKLHVDFVDLPVSSFIVNPPTGNELLELELKTKQTDESGLHSQELSAPFPKTVLSLSLSPFTAFPLNQRQRGPLSWPSLDSNKSIFLQACKVCPFTLELFCFEIPIQFQLIQLFRTSLSFKLNSVVIPLHYAQCTESLPARITPAYDGLESHISRPIRP